MARYQGLETEGPRFPAPRATAPTPALTSPGSLRNTGPEGKSKQKRRCLSLGRFQERRETGLVRERPCEL